MTNSLRGHISLFAAQIIYALNYSIAKDLMPLYIGPLALVFLRVLGACILFWLLSLFVKTDKVERKDMIKIIWLALFGIVINQVFFIYGLSLTQPINSAIIIISNPVIVFIFTMIILKERITFLKVNGLLLAMLGAYLILRYKGNFELGSDTLAGDVMTVINSISWAIFVVLIKPIMNKYETVTVTRWIFLFGSIYMIPIGINDILHTNWRGFTYSAFVSVLFVVVATTFLAYLLNIYGLKMLSTTVTSAYIYLQPFLAMLFAIALGKDNLSPTKIISGIFIILGLYLVNHKARKKAI